MSYTERFGPKVKVTFSCAGCKFCQTENESNPDKYIIVCAEPEVIERWGISQNISNRNFTTPIWCPYTQDSQYKGRDK